MGIPSRDAAELSCLIDKGSAFTSHGKPFDRHTPGLIDEGHTLARAS